jgi:acetyltransferase-like isoleucine patch superfamily enzyme
MYSRLASHILRQWKIKRDPIRYARSIGVQVGHNCRFVGFDAATFGSEPYLVRLGDHVTITTGVRFITHDGGVWIFRDQIPDIDIVQPIIVGNNVFVGVGSILLPGVHIGDNCVIGAGSVVTKDVPPNTVVAGVPARVIQSREEYFSKVKAKGMPIRNLPPDQKRSWLIQKYDELLRSGQ